MNRKEMQEWLDQFPEDTQIEVVIADRDDGSKVVDFEGTYIKEYDYTDFTENRFVAADPDHPAHGKRVLVLGEDE